MGKRHSKAAQTASPVNDLTSYINKVNDDEFCPMKNFTKEEYQELEKKFLTEGIERGIQCVSRQNDSWKKTPVNIAVIGMSGAGKSTFINAIRDVECGDVGAAAVGVTETTMEVCQYVHPRNPLIKFYDLPGVGTPSFPKDTYLEKIHVDRYDCFVIMTTSRFLDSDAWLGKEIKARKRGIYFVRTKIGVDIEGDKKANAAKHNPVVVTEKIKTNIVENLKNINVAAPVFVIDSYEKLKYDFDDLNMRIINDLPSNQRNAMLLSMSARSKTIVKAKMIVLHDRMLKIAMKCAGCNAIPVLGAFSVALRVDLLLLEDEGDFCFEDLGLDHSSLISTANERKVKVSILRAIVKKKFPHYQVDGADIQAIINEYPADQAAVMVQKIIGWVPFIGAVFASPISVAYTYHVLKVLLDRMEVVALEIADVGLSEGMDETQEPINQD